MPFLLLLLTSRGPVLLTQQGAFGGGTYFRQIVSLIYIFLTISCKLFIYEMATTYTSGNYLYTLMKAPPPSLHPACGSPEYDQWNWPTQEVEEVERRLQVRKRLKIKAKSSRSRSEGKHFPNFPSQRMEGRGEKRLIKILITYGKGRERGK